MNRVVKIFVLILIAVIFFFLAKGMNEAKTVEIGDLAYDFELEDTTGNIHRLSNYQGHYVIINFFATWCEPCINEAEELEKFQQKYGKEISLLIIDKGEPKNRVLTFKEKMKSTSLYLLDKDNKVSEKYNVVGQPETFIIDENGIIRKKIVGPTTADHLFDTISTLKAER
ncbi:TlpA family protein disulfide reductase [Calidifontibacillus erzurumensis]|uniref:TlpA family protein disulfide reductase n=1 Tax=Calidifontibacillus erzurumensis TaxID=2741433 RepID=A0A8J8GI90_9BACI|nr:TlpA disulfide reductase family protein [Calidifontibacillus erzurumensis]NSL52231.1 TlpA family protein disulfide reductase [Calidifontibacillus erzurumensis]